LAGLSLGEAARRARVSAGYLGQCERAGLNYRLAQKLSRVYGCGLHRLLVVHEGEAGYTRGRRGAVQPQQEGAAGEVVLARRPEARGETGW
jgi:hypothetical protein